MRSFGEWAEEVLAKVEESSIDVEKKTAIFNSIRDLLAKRELRRLREVMEGLIDARLRMLLPTRDEVLEWVRNGELTFSK